MKRLLLSLSFGTFLLLGLPSCDTYVDGPYAMARPYGDGYPYASSFYTGRSYYPSSYYGNYYTNRYAYPSRYSGSSYYGSRHLHPARYYNRSAYRAPVSRVYSSRAVTAVRNEDARLNAIRASASAATASGFRFR